MASFWLLPYIVPSAISPSGHFPPLSFDTEQSYMVATAPWSYPSTDHNGKGYPKERLVWRIDSWGVRRIPDTHPFVPPIL